VARTGTAAPLVRPPRALSALTPVEKLALRHVDAREATVRAEPWDVWHALGEVLARERVPGRGWVARLLNAEPTFRRGDPLVAGSTLPGFRVARAREPHELELEGQHRFARYRLVIRVREDESGSVISAESHARFIGVGGRIYRSLVVGARTHTLLVRSMLSGIRTRAEAHGA
jgi:hypothetical protein